MDWIEPRTALVTGGLLVGVAFGVLARISRFCFRSAMIELGERRAGRHSAAWLAALAVAVVATQALALTGRIDLSTSAYLDRPLAWIALIVGGMAFGVGMVLSRGCVARHMVLAGGGNLRSLAVLALLGLAAYATARGILALPRRWLAEFTYELDRGELGLTAAIASAFDLRDEVARTGALIAIVAATLILLAQVRWRERISGALAFGASIGLLIAAGWWITGVIGFDEFEPTNLTSLTFTLPVGNAIQYLLTYTGASADFGITVVAGVLLGAFLTALVTRQLRIERFDGSSSPARYLAGAILMGFGGVLAMGCTIGAGLTGVSTLSFASMLTLLSIAVGASLALRVGRIERAHVRSVPALGAAPAQ